MLIQTDCVTYFVDNLLKLFTLKIWQMLAEPGSGIDVSQLRQLTQQVTIELPSQALQPASHPQLTNSKSPKPYFVPSSGPSSPIKIPKAPRFIRDEASHGN